MGASPVASGRVPSLLVLSSRPAKSTIRGCGRNCKLKSGTPGRGVQPFLWAQSCHFQHFPLHLILYFLLFAFRSQESLLTFPAAAHRSPAGQTRGTLVPPCSVFTKKAIGGRERTPSRDAASGVAHTRHTRSEGKGELQTTASHRISHPLSSSNTPRKEPSTGNIRD